MKTEHVTLIAASLAAAASLGGILLNQRGALSLEREKWQQAQSDTTDKMIADFGRDLLAASHEARWLVWTGEHSPATFSLKSIEDYDVYAKKALPTISSHLILLAARSPQAANQVNPVTSDFFALDDCIAKASIRYRTDKQAGLKALTECGSLTFRITDRSPVAFARAAQAARGVVHADTPASGPYKW